MMRVDDDGIPLHDCERDRALAAAAELVLRDSAALLLAQLQGWESLMNPESKHYDASFAPSLAAIRAAIACANGTSPAIRRPVRLFDSV